MTDHPSPEAVLAKWDKDRDAWDHELAEAVRAALKQRDELGAEGLALDRRKHELEVQLAEVTRERDDWYVGCREAEKERDEARAVVKAIQKYTDNLGQHHYWRCSSRFTIECSNIETLETICDCGGEQLWDALAELQKAGRGEPEKS